MRAIRRNGGVSPDTPYPPLEPAEPFKARGYGRMSARLTQDAAPSTVGNGSEQKADPPRRRNTPDVATAGRSDAVDKAASGLPDGVGNGADYVPPSAGAPAGKAPASDLGPPLGAPPASPEAGGAAPEQAESASATVTQLHLAVTEDSTIPVTVKVHPMVAAYKADLERMELLETRKGQQVLTMAEKLVSSATSPAAAANLSKELERLMDALVQASPENQVLRDPSVAIRERTIAKLRAVQTERSASA